MTHAVPRWRSLLTVLGIVAFWVVAPAMVGAAQANAIPGVSDCKDAPTPDTPGTGPAYWFLDQPASTPAGGDPFAERPTTTIYEQYGLGGATFQTYDLGCGGFARDPLDIALNGFANLAMQFSIVMTAFTGWVLRAAFTPSTLFGDLDNYVGTATSVLRDKVFNPYSIPVLVLSAMWLFQHARKRDNAAIATWVAVAAGMIAAVTLLSTYPQTAGHAADDTVASVVGTVSSGFAGEDPSNPDNNRSDPATSAIANLDRAVLYQPWLTGTFGNANSDMARKYGPALFDAGTLTWEQSQLPKDERNKVIADKQTAFEDTMSKIKDEDPSAYEMVQGKHPENRVGMAALSGFASIVAGGFLLVSGLLMLVAFMVVRLAVMLAPVLLCIGLFPPMFNRVKGVVEGVGATLLGCIIVGVGAALDTLLIGAVMAPGTTLSPVKQVLLMFMLTAAFLVILLPFIRVHRLFRNAMTRAGSGFASYGRRFRRGLSDDDTREEREERRARDEAERARRRASRRPEATPEPEPMYVNATRTSYQTQSRRGPGETPDGRVGGGVPTPYRAPEKPGLPGGPRAVPQARQRAIGSGSAPTPQPTREEETVTYLEPDEIFSPADSGRAETLPDAPARPNVNDGAERYGVFEPYRPPAGKGTEAAARTSRPESGDPQ